MALDLKRVPKWAWVAAGLVAVGVYLYMRHRGTSANPAAEPTAASPIDAAALGGTPGGGGATGGGADDTASLLSDIAAQQQQFLSDFLANQQGLDSAGITPTDWQALAAQLLAQTGSASMSSTPTGGLSPVGTATSAGASLPLYQTPTGGLFTVGPSGVTQPAYGGPSGGYVSPATYAGLGIIPQPITSSMVAPPIPPPAAPKYSAPQQTALPSHFYTYKKDVPLSKGETLHFAAGKGYYPA